MKFYKVKSATSKQQFTSSPFPVSSQAWEEE